LLPAGKRQNPGVMQNLNNGVDGMLAAAAVLSPMAGVTDIPFRLICRKYGCRFAFTEMVDVNGIAYRNIKTMKYLDMADGDSPLGAQIVGADEKRLLDAALVCQDRGFRVIDVNAGCPARKVIKGGKGAALLKHPLKLGRILGSLTSKLEVQVTVKIRLGWDEQSVNYLEVAKIAESEGASAICVHPRTREQMYRGGSISHEPTRQVKQAVKIPVFASGNIFSEMDAKKVMEDTGCDGVFAARGTLGRPWIFDGINKVLEGGVPGEEPGLEEIKLIMLEHFRLSERHYGKFLAVKRMYKHVTWYLKRYKNLNAVMNVYREVKDAVSFEEFIAKIGLNDRRMVV
jgi:tRNA-dihydrouridine synthase B